MALETLYSEFNKKETERNFGTAVVEQVQAAVTRDLYVGEVLGEPDAVCESADPNVCTDDENLEKFIDSLPDTDPSEVATLFEAARNSKEDEELPAVVESTLAMVEQYIPDSVIKGV